MISERTTDTCCEHDVANRVLGVPRKVFWEANKGPWSLWSTEATALKHNSRACATNDNVTTMIEQPLFGVGKRP
jgi:hypothetical protein